jgi:hypothetical protein
MAFPYSITTELKCVPDEEWEAFQRLEIKRISESIDAVNREISRTYSALAVVLGAALLLAILIGISLAIR